MAVVFTLGSACLICIGSLISGLNNLLFNLCSLEIKMFDKFLMATAVSLLSAKLS